MQEAAGLKDTGLKVQPIFSSLKSALEDDKSVSVIACPVDYFENIEFTYKLRRIRDAL